jgi:hypothetical protein
MIRFVLVEYVTRDPSRRRKTAVGFKAFTSTSEARADFGRVAALE